MIPVILLVTTLTLSLTITRIGTLALVLTGMSKDAAHFQARSAFYGVGFTTRESEAAVNHPVRRQIITLLMLLGHLGIATVVATIMISLLVTSGSGQWARGLLTLVGGLLLLVAVANSRPLDRVMSRLVTAALRKWTRLTVQDYVALLNLSSGYAVMEIEVQPGDGLDNMLLRDLHLSHHGVLVLGIQRLGRRFEGAPEDQTRIGPRDKLILYGPIQRLEEITASRGPTVALYSDRISQPDPSTRSTPRSPAAA